MKPEHKRWTVLIGIVFFLPIILSVLFSIPYIYTVIGYTGWPFFGHLITIDDDFPGGWSNPFGTEPMPWGALMVKGLIFMMVVLCALAFPEIRQHGNNQRGLIPLPPLLQFLAPGLA